MASNFMCSKRKCRDWVDDDDGERESFTEVRCEPLCCSSYNPFESDFHYSFYYDDDEFDGDDIEDDASSVGSNEFIDEIILISDDDEAENRVAFQENKGFPVVEERDNQRVFLENYRAAIAEEEEHEEQERLFLMNYGSLIIDHYGNLLGEFQHLDDDLIIRE